MNWKTIKTAKAEAERFLERVAEYEQHLEREARRVEDETAKGREYICPVQTNNVKESAALKRASMDLTRALADMRKRGK